MFLMAVLQRKMAKTFHYGELFGIYIKQVELFLGAILDK